MSVFIKVAIPLKDAVIIELRRFEDKRGFFLESFKKSTFLQLELPSEIVQENHSLSKKNVLRGMHYQLAPFAQGKLLYCIKGKIFDVILDLRKSSPTFKNAFAIELDENKPQMLWIPPGFAHGFYTLSDEAYISYKVFGSEYQPSYERSIHWQSPEICKLWPLSDTPIVSPKDSTAPYLHEAEYNFD